MSFFSFFKKKQKPQIVLQPKQYNNFDFEAVVLSYTPGTGKTNLLRRVTNQVFIKNSGATIGIDFGYFKFNDADQKIKGRIYDGPSQVRFRQILKNAYSIKMKALKQKFIVFLVIPQFNCNFQQFYTYLQQILSYSDQCSFIICQTQSSSKINGQTIASKFIKQYLKDQMKIFKVFPQTDQVHMSVGKTSLCRTLLDQSYKGPSNPTMGYDFLKTVIKTQQYQFDISIWDTQTKIVLLSDTLKKLMIINQTKKTFVVFVIPEINFYFEKFIVYFNQVIRILGEDKLIIACQIKWIKNIQSSKVCPNSITTTEKIKSIFKDKIKFFSIYPQINKGVLYFKNFLAQYYANIHQKKQQLLYSPKKQGIQSYIQLMNKEYNKLVIQQKVRESKQKMQKKLKYYKQLSQIYKNQLIKNDLYKPQLQNQIEKDHQEFQSQKVEKGQIKDRQEIIQKQEINETQKSSDFGQIQQKFQQKLKKNHFNLSQIKRQIKGVYSSFAQSSERQNISFISMNNQSSSYDNAQVQQNKYLSSFFLQENLQQSNKEVLYKIQREDDQKSVTFSQIENEFLQKIKGKEIRTNNLEVQLQSESDNMSQSSYKSFKNENQGMID